MNVAILIISSTSLVCSAGCLCVMLKTAHELQQAKKKIDADVENFKAKTNRNVRRISNALNEIEL